MPRISIRGNTLYYREPEHTEVVGVVDGEGTLWLKEIPNGQALCPRGPLHRSPRQEDHEPRAEVATGAQVQGSGLPVDSRLGQSALEQSLDIHELFLGDPHQSRAAANAV